MLKVVKEEGDQQNTGFFLLSKPIEELLDFAVVCDGCAHSCPFLCHSDLDPSPPGLF